jgi:hypothetical protein
VPGDRPAPKARRRPARRRVPRRPAERAAFESALRDNPALQAELDLEQHIETSIRRLTPYAAPTAKAPAARRLLRPALLAIAAILALAVGIGLYVLSRPTAPSPASAYQRLVSTGFKPTWVCETDDEFVEFARKRTGHPFLIPMATPGVQVVGWSYPPREEHGILSGLSAYILTRVEGREVVVIADAKARDRALALDGPRLHLHRRELGGVVLYEVSPFDQPRVIPQAR